jgi:hypothetical protein
MQININIKFQFDLPHTKLNVGMENEIEIQFYGLRRKFSSSFSIRTGILQSFSELKNPQTALLCPLPHECMQIYIISKRKTLWSVKRKRDGENHNGLQNKLAITRKLH